MRVRGGAETGVFNQSNIGDVTKTILMPILVDGLYLGTSIKYEILIGGVVFNDGSLSKTLKFPLDFSTGGEASLVFLKAGSIGSNCFKATVSQGLNQIAVYQ
jgi:hypothetical protein